MLVSQLSPVAQPVSNGHTPGYRRKGRIEPKSRQPRDASEDLTADTPSAKQSEGRIALSAEVCQALRVDPGSRAGHKGAFGAGFVEHAFGFSA